MRLALKSIAAFAAISILSELRRVCSKRRQSHCAVGGAHRRRCAGLHGAEDRQPEGRARTGRSGQRRQLRQHARDRRLQQGIPGAARRRQRFERRYRQRLRQQRRRPAGRQQPQVQRRPDQYAGALGGRDPAERIGAGQRADRAASRWRAADRAVIIRPALEEMQRGQVWDFRKPSSSGIDGEAWLCLNVVRSASRLQRQFIRPR